MSDIRFRPVRGKESIIKDQAVVDGTIYFATDSGKIFVDAQGERSLMGGSGTSVLYTEATSIIEKTDGTYVIPTSTLVDQGYMPRRDDLIINTDGRFFKVFQADSNSIVAYLLAVSGNGTGGNTPGGPSGDDQGITIQWHDVKKVFIAGRPYNIEFTATSPTDKYITVEYRVETPTAVVETKTIEVISGERTSIEVGSKMSTSGYNAVYFTFIGMNAGSITATINRIKAIEFKIEQDNANFNNYRIYNSTFNYYVNIKGSVSKELHVTVDDNKTLTPVTITGDKTGYPITINCSSLGLTAGRHTITAYLIADGLPSNIIATEFIYHPEGSADTTYIIVADYPQTCYTYETPNIKYWVYNTAQPVNTINKIDCYINGELDKTVYEAQFEGSGAGLHWNVGMLPAGINSLTLACNGINNTIEINTIQSDIFNVVTDSAILLLDASGRSNSTSLEKRLEWSYGSIKAELKDFNWYNNGWYTDSDGRTCLRISNGASVEIPFKLFTNTQPSTGGYTVEFEFKPYNLYSYDLLSASTKTEGEDENVTINRTYNPSKAIIKYLQGIGSDAYGFCCGTQDAYCRLSDGTSVATRYSDNEIVTVAFSIHPQPIGDVSNENNLGQIVIYINGIMSGISSYSRQLGEMPTLADKLYITSEYCDIDLYNIKVYSGKALTSAEIVQNYISNKKDLIIYNQNKLSTGTSVSLSDISEYNENNPDNSTIPYAIITTKAPDVLPYVKVDDDKDAEIVDIEFINPSLDYKFNMDQISEDEYLHQAPSFTATNVIFNVQGTSSQKYPRKNFKAKFKNSTITYTHDKLSEENKISSNKKLYLDSQIGEKTFTWKADYMDSSSCHNTGFANFVKSIYDKHPLQYYGEQSSDVSDYRTTIYGFPMLVFHKKSTQDVEFIGIYNFNLDKGCDDTLGFTHDGKNKILNKSYKDVAECWEFGNNKGTRCSFKGEDFDAGYDYATKTGKLRDLGTDLEVRYHWNADNIEAAFNNQDEDGNSISDEQAFNTLLGGTEKGKHPNGYGNLEKLFIWLQENDFVSESDPTEKEKKLNKFKDEFELHFNKDYCLIYYILTDLLIQYDSRGKNMMLATWGPIDYKKDITGQYIIDPETNEKIPGEYIWFPIYYDVDTQLGVNNSGVPLWDYNLEPSAITPEQPQRVFSTANSILWTCFQEAFMNDIAGKYRSLREGKLKISNLNNYYNFNPETTKSEAMRGILPINIINANEYYKYIAPAIDGAWVTDDLGDPVFKKEAGYYYCLQGTREQYRAQFLRNRFNYYDSMWLAGSYDPSKGSSNFMRMNSYTNIQDATLNSNTILNITPQLDQYIVAWPDDTNANSGVLTQIKAKGGVQVPYDIKDTLGEDGYQQQIIKVGGGSFIQDFGNLSLLYIDEIDFKTSNLRTIQLGNDNDKYYHPYAQNLNAKLKDVEINEGGKAQLQVFDITNISDIDIAISLTTANKLTAFKALGTKITAALFANGVALNQLYLPETVIKLELIEAYNLDKIYYNYNDILEDGKQSKPGLYIENVIHHDDDFDIDITRLNSIKLVGGALDLYSYDLLNKLTAAKIATSGKTIEGHTDKLTIHCEDVHWTPYTQLGRGAAYDSTTTYYYANTNCTYSEYAYTNPNKWNKDLAEGKIYTYDSTLISLAPTNFDLLDTYIIDNGSYFTNIYTEEKDKGLPALSGSLFINGQVSEYDIANKYNAKFPDLVIYAQNVTEAYRACYISENDGVETTLVIDRYANASDVIIPPDVSKLVIPQHYDFVGWKIKGDDSGTIYKTTDDFAGLTFGTNEIVFILQTTPHTYEFKFKDGDGTEYSVPVVYNTLATLPEMIPYKAEDNNLAFDEVYKFVGWSADSNYYGLISSEQIAENVRINIEAIRATQDRMFYAMFVKDSVQNSVLDVSYFKITYYSGDYKTYNNVVLYSGEYASIALKSQYKDTLRGKITIPSWVPSENNQNIMVPVMRLYSGCFENCKNITHCFFAKNKNDIILLDAIGNSSFKSCSNLRYVELPSSLGEIEAHAFESCGKLSTSIQDHDLVVGGNITKIGTLAFSLGEDSESKTWTTNIHLGDKVQYIIDQAFAFIDRQGGEIRIGDSNNATSLTSIGQNTFRRNPSYNNFVQLTVYCQDSAHEMQLRTLCQALIGVQTIGYGHIGS